MKTFPVRIVCEELGGWSRTGKVYRAQELDGTPLYCGAETRSELIEKLKTEHPRAVVVEG